MAAVARAVGASPPAPWTAAEREMIDRHIAAPGGGWGAWIAIGARVVGIGLDARRRRRAAAEGSGDAEEEGVEWSGTRLF